MGSVLSTCIPKAQDPGLDHEFPEEHNVETKVHTAPSSGLALGGATPTTSMNTAAVPPSFSSSSSSSSSLASKGVGAGTNTPFALPGGASPHTTIRESVAASTKNEHHYPSPSPSSSYASFSAPASSAQPLPSSTHSLRKETPSSPSALPSTKNKEEEVVEEIDYFEGMEPTLVKPKIITPAALPSAQTSSRLSLVEPSWDEAEDGGWGDEDD
ncbi:hypothetical protein QOT17_002600 [Balamuthia mandrillaris]